MVGAVDIEAVVARNLLQHERRIFNRAGNRPAVIHGPGQWNDAADTDTPISRFEADHAAVRRGSANGTAGIRSQGGITVIHGNGCRGTARRPARIALQVPWIPHRPPVADRGSPSMREFMHVALADQYGARSLALAYKFGVLLRYAVLE